MSLRQAEPFSYGQAMASYPMVIEQYFNLLEDIIRSNGLTQRQGQIFNCDETGLSLSHKPPKVVVKAGQNTHMLLHQTINHKLLS